ncbi:MAG: hypothetical protein HYW57_10625, partial [Ignavibacteriales bacterium]|nr:hypothetical protein [Ignavibacteriales bacterium]
MTKKRIPNQTKSKPTRAKLYITGESPLVEEYAELCAERGYEVFVQWNVTGKKRKTEKKFRQSNIIPAKTTLALELTNTDLDQKRRNLQKIDKALLPTHAIISTSVTVAASEQATWINRKHRLVGFGALPTFFRTNLVEVAPTVHSPKETVEVVQRFFHSLGKETELVQDRVGLVFPRIVCQVVNEATFALQDDVASPSDIDTAMKLGL